MFIIHQMGDNKKPHRLAQNTKHMVDALNEASASFNAAKSTQDPVSRAEFNTVNTLLSSKINNILQLLQHKSFQPSAQQQVPTLEPITIADISNSSDYEGVPMTSRSASIISLVFYQPPPVRTPESR